MVENKWLELGLPNLLETEVNKAVDSVAKDTSGTKKLTSSFSRPRRPNSPNRLPKERLRLRRFAHASKTLAGEVAAEFTQSFTSVAARSASASTACIQTYLGNTYGSAVATAYEQEIQAQVEKVGTEALTGNFQPDTLGLRSGVGVASIGRRLCCQSGGAAAQHTNLAPRRRQYRHPYFGAGGLIGDSRGRLGRRRWPYRLGRLQQRYAGAVSSYSSSACRRRDPKANSGRDCHLAA